MVIISNRNSDCTKSCLLHSYNIFFCYNRISPQCLISFYFMCPFMISTLQTISKIPSCFHFFYQLHCICWFCLAFIRIHNSKPDHNSQHDQSQIYSVLFFTKTFFFHFRFLSFLFSQCSRKFWKKPCKICSIK